MSEPPQDNSLQPVANSRWPHRAVIFVGAAAALSLLGDQALYAVLPTYYKTLGLTAIQVGILLSVNRWIRLVTNHVAEHLVHHYSPTRMLCSVLLLSAGIAFMYGAVPLFVVLLSMRVLWGLCWSVIRQVGVMTAIDTSHGGNAAKIIGFHNGIARSGSAMGMVAGGLLFDVFTRSGIPTLSGDPFFWTFAAMGVGTLVSLPPAVVARRSLAGQHSNFRAARDTVQAKGFGGLRVIAFVLGCVGPGIMMSSLGYVLKARVGESMTVAGMVIGVATLNGLILALRYVMNLLGGPALGSLQDRIGYRAGAVLFLSVATGALAVAALSQGPVPLVAMVVLFFLCATALNVVLMAETGRGGSRAFAKFATAMDFGSATGPLLAWTVFSFVNVPSLAFVIGEALYSVAVVIAVVRLIRFHRPGSEEKIPEKI